MLKASYLTKKTEVVPQNNRNLAPQIRTGLRQYYLLCVIENRVLHTSDGLKTMLNVV
jgi:hypothetical protein